MVKLLLEDERIDVGLLNSDKKAAYEAYNDQFGFDEASALVEKRHLYGQDQSEKRGSSLFLKDFSKEQRQVLSNKNTSLADKAKLIESHIFESSGGELNYDDEIREQLRKSHEL